MGILVVHGGEPGKFNARLHRDKKSLLLCTDIRCIMIKNWCNSRRYRLIRMEFSDSLIQKSIVINNIDRLDCQQQTNNNTNDNKLISVLNQKFINAQELLLMEDDADSDSDVAQLMRCLGIVFAEKIINDNVYEIFGFPSFIEQVYFIQNICKLLSTRDNIEQISLDDMKKSLINNIKKFKLTFAKPSDQKIIWLFYKKINELNSDGWQNLKSEVYKTMKNDNDSNRTIKMTTINSIQSLSCGRQQLWAEINAHCLIVEFAAKHCNYRIYRETCLMRRRFYEFNTNM